VMIFAPNFGRRLVRGRTRGGRTEAEPTAAYAPSPRSEIPVTAS
jgi:hypothetical protein